MGANEVKKGKSTDSLTRDVIIKKPDTIKSEKLTPGDSDILIDVSDQKMPDGSVYNG